MFPPVKGTQGSLHLSRLTRGYLSWCGASLRGKSPGRVALGRSLPSAPWLASQKSCKVPTGSWEGEGARAGTDPETEVQATEAWRGSDSGGCPHALSSSAFLVLEAEKLVGKPVSMQILALLGNDPGELPVHGLLPALPEPPPTHPPPHPGALTSWGQALSLLASCLNAG